MKKKILPSLRLNEDTFEQMELSLVKLNKNQIIPLTMNDFRRLSYELLIKTILEGKELPKLQV